MLRLIKFMGQAIDPVDDVHEVEIGTINQTNH